MDLRRPLLAWFRRAKRDLPWRRTRDPYRILVSEVMLQQTQVDRVIPFYERFLDRFPTLESLAEASLDDVLRAWSGLGYYSRARHLHAAARAIVEQHSGRFPDSFEALLALPGVGPYTAGAVASIAFGLPFPAVDANARRVLSRVFHLPDEPPNHIRARIERIATPARSPGDYNQALMELGSLICTPRAPSCDTCCIAKVCRLHALGDPVATPKPPRLRSPKARSACAVVHRRGRVLIAQRAPTGLWGGLWEFPHCEYTAREGPRNALRALLREAFCLQVEVGPEITSFTHGSMCRRIALTAYSCLVTRGRTKARRHPRTRWVAPEDLLDYPLPSPHRRVAELL
jgi:A/G-specific adenine glycosylase